MRADGTEDLRARLDAWKARLIDLGKRNRLLYFKETRRGTLRLEGADIDELCAHLSRDGAQIVFAPREGGGEPTDGAPSTAHTGEGPLTVRTALTEADLERTLTNLYRKSRESVAELGVHTLHLALGSLHWHESDSSDEEICSPLVLMPVELVRRRGGGMSVRGLGDPPIANIALAEKLRRDFSLELPTLATPDSTPASPTAYVDEVGKAAAGLARSSVRRGAVLALLSFAKAVMYEDLGRSNERALSNPIVRGLCRHIPVDAEWDVPTGEELDRRTPYDESFEVLDADSSQREAIAAARRGRSFVLVGPPGTGKSQTIANTIAAMLADTRRVLFVSEKKAALEVVEARLRECGLTQFCLNLHRFRGNKREVLDQLDARLRGVEGAGTDRLVDLAQADFCRERLNGYARSLHAPFGVAGMTPYEVHGKLSEVADAPALPFTLGPRVAGLDRRWFAEVEGLLGDLETVSHVYEEADRHPWWGFKPPVRDPTARAGFQGDVERLRWAAQEVARSSEEVAEAMAVPPPRSLGRASALAAASQMLGRLRPGIVQPDWAGLPTLQRLVELATEAEEASVRLSTARGALAGAYRASLYADDLDGLCERFVHYRRSWWGRAWGARRDVQGLRAHLRDPAARRTFAEFAADAAHLGEVRHGERWFVDTEPELRAAFGGAYRGPRTEWGAVLADLAAVAELKRVLGADCTPEWLRARLEGLAEVASELGARGGAFG